MSTYNNPNDRNWSNDHSILQRHVYNILVMKCGISMTNEQVNEIFSSDAVENYWVPAFTHKTVDAANNYETFELFGDKGVGCATPQYMRKIFGKDITEH